MSNQKYKIITNVASNPEYSAPGSPKYPWAEMEVGNAFDVPVEDNIESMRISLYQSGKQWFKKNRGIDAKISIAKIDDSTLRVKRVA